MSAGRVFLQHYAGKEAADNDKNRRLAEKALALYLKLRAIMKDGSQERGSREQAVRYVYT